MREEAGPAFNRATKAAIVSLLECRGIDPQDKGAATEELLTVAGGRALCRFYLEYVYMEKGTEQ